MALGSIEYFYSSRRVSVHLLTGRVASRETCRKRPADLPCCENRRHYNPHAHRESTETQPARVCDKDEAGFRDCFGVCKSRFGPGQSHPDQARARFDDFLRK
jgi:hypothetical protein